MKKPYLILNSAKLRYEYPQLDDSQFGVLADAKLSYVMPFLRSSSDLLCGYCAYAFGTQKCYCDNAEEKEEFDCE